MYSDAAPIKLLELALESLYVYKKKEIAFFE